MLLLSMSRLHPAIGQNNLGFEHGLSQWIVSGGYKNVHIDTTTAHSGKHCVRIGEAQAGIFRRFPVAPLSILEVDCYVRSDRDTVGGHCFVRFYDSKHVRLLEYRNRFAGTINYQQTGIYTEAPASAAYMESGVEKDSMQHGYLYADDFSVQSNVGEPRKKHAPMFDLGTYMRPFWHSDTIFNEAVLLYSIDDSMATGRLLYQPDRVLSVTSYDLKMRYQQGKDYALNGNIIIRALNSRAPYRADTSFEKKDLAWYNLQSAWVVVTYTHHDKWNSPVPLYKGDQLPNTTSKLKARTSLTVTALGMSITRGMNVSGFDDVPPYMPSYVELFVRQLRKAYHFSSIKFYNAGLPGATVDWGANYAEKYINPLKPDLVLIDFGMNDFWRLTPDRFKEYVSTIMNKIRSGNPKVEFILLSNMKFDPDYILDSDEHKSFYQSNLEGYSRVLEQMQAQGAVNLDMYSISDAIFQIKKAKDCIANPLHPNDYLVRWYAQGLAALLIE